MNSINYIVPSNTWKLHNRLCISITPKNGLIWTKGATKFLRDKALETYNLGGMVARVDGHGQTALGYKVG